MTYMLRLHSDADKALWARFKARSEQEGIPMRALVLRLIEAYADGKVRVSARPTPTPPAGSPH